MAGNTASDAGNTARELAQGAGLIVIGLPLGALDEGLKQLAIQQAIYNRDPYGSNPTERAMAVNHVNLTWDANSPLAPLWSALNQIPVLPEDWRTEAALRDHKLDH